MSSAQLVASHTLGGSQSAIFRLGGFLRSPGIVDLGGLPGPRAPGKPSKRWGAQPSTFWKVFPGPWSRTELSNRRPLGTTFSDLYSAREAAHSIALYKLVIHHSHVLACASFVPDLLFEEIHRDTSLCLSLDAGPQAPQLASGPPRFCR